MVYMGTCRAGMAVDRRPLGGQRGSLYGYIQGRPLGGQRGGLHGYIQDSIPLVIVHAVGGEGSLCVGLCIGRRCVKRITSYVYLL